MSALKDSLNAARLGALAGQNAASHWCKNLEGDFSNIVMHLDAALRSLETQQSASVASVTYDLTESLAFDPTRMRTDQMLQPLGGRDCVTGERIEVVHADDCRKIELEKLEQTRELADASNELNEVVQILGRVLTGEPTGIHIGHAADMARKVAEKFASMEGMATVPHDKLVSGEYYWWKGNERMPWQPAFVRPGERSPIQCTHGQAYQVLFGDFVGPIGAPRMNNGAS